MSVKRRETQLIYLLFSRLRGKRRAGKKHHVNPQMSRQRLKESKKIDDDLKRANGLLEGAESKSDFSLIAFPFSSRDRPSGY